MGSPTGRWVIATSVLGSGIAFIDGTVVNAALPAIATDLGADLSGLQWVVTGYLLTLSALLVIGGSLGDQRGRRRIFVIGLAGFAATSVVCGLAPTVTLLIVARLVQGCAAALLLPASLAIISSTFAPEDRGAAIGAWSGLGGIAGAIGPFVGGYLIGAVSWRAVFFINVPLCAVAIAMAQRHVPETRDVEADPHLDLVGGVSLAVGLGGLVYALIEGPPTSWGAIAVVAGIVGAAALAAFIIIERRSDHPMVPLHLFAVRQFSGANLTTLFVYAAIGSTMFLVIVHLQTDLGYSALQAGASMLPLTFMMLLLSARSGAVAQRIGPRLPMTIGPVVVGAGVLLFVRAQPGVSYVAGVLPAVVVLGAGLVITVAPLTAAVLAAVDDHHAGIGSAINNAIARIGSLLAVAVLPAAAGLTDATGNLHLTDGFSRAMVLTAVLAAAGGVLAFATVRDGADVGGITLGSTSTPCLDPCVKRAALGDAA
jgi:EmrB/QacA subfamily drug resistance transporter